MTYKKNRGPFNRESGLYQVPFFYIFTKQLSLTLGRRNLSDLDKAALLARKEPILAEQAKARRRATQNNNSAKAVPVNLPEQVIGSKGEVREQLAKELGVSGK